MALPSTNPEEINPFRFGEVVAGHHFCPRPEQKTLRQLILGGHKAVVLGERRTGKTSLMLEAARSLRGVDVAYAQLWAVDSLEDFVERLLLAVTALGLKRKNLLQQALSSLSLLRPTIKFNAADGQPSLSLTQGSVPTPAGLSGLFDFIGELASQRKLVVILDEFQDIRRLENSESLLGALRDRIQRQDHVPYLFCGSIRHEMEAIFRSPSSPFFKSFRTVEIGPLEVSTFHAYLAERFQRGKSHFPVELFEQILELTSSNPSDVQQLCAALWDTSPRAAKLDAHSLERALTHLFATERKGYESQLRILTNQQLRVLRTLAEVGGERPQSKDFLRASGVPLAASVKRALQRLQQLQLIYGPELNHKFFDPFLREWLRQRRDMKQ